MVYDVAARQNPVFLTYFNQHTAATGDHGPEGLLLIPADKSPSGKAQLVVGQEVSGTTSIAQINLGSWPLRPAVYLPPTWLLCPEQALSGRLHARPLFPHHPRPGA